MSFSRSALRNNRLFSCSVLLLLYCIGRPQFCHAADREYELKAGFIYNFVRYSEFSTPQDSFEHYTICSPSERFITAANIALQGQELLGKPISLSKIELTNPLPRQCQTVFISTEYAEEWQKLSPRPIAINTLFVGETRDFIDHGGHISFFLAGGKVRFEVSQLRLKLSGIHMSSKVLRLGRIRKE